MTIRIYIVLFFTLTLISGGLSVYFFMVKQLYPATFFTIITIGFFFHILHYIFKIFRDVEDFSEAAQIGRAHV